MSNSPEDPKKPTDSADAIARAAETMSRIKELTGNVGYARNEPPPIPKEGEKPKGVISRAPSQKREPKFKPGLELNQGKQVVKGYSVTEDQLDSLSLLGVIATACFSGAAGLLGFAVNLKSTLDLAVGAPVAAASWWSGVNVSAALASGVLLLAGGFFYKKRFSKLRQIKNNTKFDGE